MRTARAIDYDSPDMDRFWACVAEANLPVNFHIGEVPSSGGRGGFGTFFLMQAAPFRRAFGALIFGGIFDRHPNLQVVFAEGGINWIAGALQDAELTYGAHRELFDWPMKHRPSHYWQNNMFATFQTDTIGLKLLDYLGADRVMWPRTIRTVKAHSDTRPARSTTSSRQPRPKTPERSSAKMRSTCTS